MERINWISRCRTWYWIFFLKKNWSNRSNILGVHQVLKILGVAISSHIVSFCFCFFPISEHFCVTQENQNQSIRSRKTSCKWGIFFPIISNGNIFRADRKKILVSLITGESVPAALSIILIWWSQRFICFFFILIQFCYASIEWTETSTAVFYHCWSYRGHSDLWIRCVVYIWY